MKAKGSLFKRELFFAIFGVCEMIELNEICEMFEEIEFGCEYGSLAIVKCEDGVWYCNRDIETLSKSIEFKRANISMQEALRVSQLDEEELFLEREDLAAQEMAYSSQNDIERMNLDYFGTKREYVDTFFSNAFEPRFGFGFSL